MTNEELIRISEEIVSIYEKYVIQDLEKEKNTIVEILEKKFLEFSSHYKLSYSNSVYPTKKVYSVIARIKKANSLYEKLHRKNLIFKLIKEFNINKLADVSEKNDQLKTKIRNEFDDNIGVRIVCDLKNDIKKSLELIQNKQYEFEGIKFLNLKDQPVTQNNGFEIYKIDCEYNKIKFELQIKSKIGSAWDDLEHDLYYKDHSISMIKQINSKSLVHIGNLLKQLDCFMFDLRELNLGRDTLDETKHLINLETHFREAIKPFTKSFMFNFSSISNELLFMLHDKLDGLCASIHFQDKLSEILDKRENRHDSWELIILEAIYNDMCPKSNNPTFKEKYFEYLFHAIGAFESYKEYLEEIYNYAFEELPGSTHLLNREKYETLVELFNILEEIYYERSLEDLEDDKNVIFMMFANKYFGISDNDVHSSQYEVYKSYLEKLKIFDNTTEIIKKLGY